MKIQLQFDSIKENKLIDQASRFGIPGLHKLFHIGNIFAIIEGALLKGFQIYLNEKYPEVELQSIHFVKANDENAYNSVELEGKIDNYPTFMVKLLPLLKKALQNAEGVQPIFTVLEMIETEAPQSLQGAIAPLGNDKMEDIIITLVSGYNDLICERINRRLDEKGVSVRIKKIVITK